MAERPRFITPLPDLKRKAVNQKKGLPPEVTPELIAGFEAVVNASRDNFISQVAPKLAAMRSKYPGSDADQNQIEIYMKQVGSESYAIKGLGAMFGYPLLTAVAKSLNDFVSERLQFEPAQLNVVKLHIDTLYCILATRVTGSGGMTERQVIDGLKELTQRFD